jgi:hypothetical protein
LSPSGQLPQAWLAGHPDAPFHTAGSVEAGIALPKKLAGDGLVYVTAGDLGGQAFSAGLVDEIAMDVAPVVLWVKGCVSSAATPAPSSSRIPTRWSEATACCTCTTQSSADRPFAVPALGPSPLPIVSSGKTYRLRQRQLNWCDRQQIFHGEARCRRA